MDFPADFKYSKQHQWVRPDGNNAYIGITDYAQDSLGTIIYLESPETGAVLSAGSALCVVESMKSTSDIYSPVSGTIVMVNKEVADKPEKINKDPYGCWIAMVEVSDPQELSGLMDSEEYKTFCKSKG